MTKNKAQNTPLILIILDGWGLSENQKGNAVALASTPYIDKLQKQYPFTTLSAHGKYVGLPPEQVGNSEAGHMNIGAGRVVEQDAVRINRDVINGNFFKNSALLSVVKHVRKNNSRLHLMGLISNGMSPHTNIKHLIGLLELARRYNIKNVYLHLFTDGRDSPQYQAIEIIKRIRTKLREGEEIVTVMGRFYAMDRKKKWERTDKAYHALVSGKAQHFSDSQEGIITNYNKGETDEYIKPFIVDDHDNNKRISDHDGMVFFNLRSDRARQLTKAFVQKKFNHMNPGAFKRRKVVKDLVFVALTNFGPELGDILTAYPDIKIDDTLPEVLKEQTQAYMAESEKHAHVTYFFNGGKPGKVNGEDHIIFKSPNVRSYKDTPEMKSRELTERVLKDLKKNKYEVTILNFAAPDMIGHTGNLESAQKACEILDDCVKQITEKYLKKKGTVLITADHGNAERMIEPETEQVNTKHTVNPVPFILINKDLKKLNLRKKGVLADIAPTILDLLGLDKPLFMKGRSLINGK